MKHQRSRMKVLTKSHFRGSWWCSSSHIFQLPSKRPGGKTGGFTQTLISRNANLLQFPAATKPSCPHQREKTFQASISTRRALGRDDNHSGRREFWLTQGWRIDSIVASLCDAAPWRVKSKFVVLCISSSILKISHGAK